jgi:hypothetical protein
MGWGLKHSPLYVPDPRDPHDLAETAVGHAVTGGGMSLALRAYAGSWPAGGHLAQMYRALLSPAHIGSRAMGTNALADTVYALRVYSEPFRYVGRIGSSAAAIPLAAAIGTVAAFELHGESTQMDKMSSLAGSGTGSTRKQKIARLGDF